MNLHMTRPVHSKQDFINDCTEWCKTFLDQNQVAIAYVRKGKRPSQQIYVETEEGVKVAVRQGRRKPIGVMAAYRGNDGVLRVGWSLCRKSEPFHPKIGLRYALERAEDIQYVKRDILPPSFKVGGRSVSAPTLDDVPQTVKKPLIAFIQRIEKGNL